MQGLTEIYMVYSFSRGLEEGKFSRILPDYIYYHLIILPIIVLTTFFTAPPLISSTPSLLSALTYTWCVANYDQTVNFYFMQIKASLLPAVFLGFRLLVDGRASFFQALTGMCAAYIYNCIETASLGPLMSVITGQQMLEPPHRVGTTATTTTHNVWYYSQGYLPAPVWLRTTISRLTGIDYNSRIFQRPYGMMFQAKQPAKSAATQTSFLRRMSNNAFQGRGQRLGGTPEQKGRVVTIIPSDKIVDTPEFKPDILKYELADNPEAQQIINDSAQLYSELRVWGCIYYIPPQYAAMATKYLDFREKDGYTIHKIHFNVTDPCGHEDVLQGLACENGRYVVESMIYIGTVDNESFVGPEDVETTAKVIHKSAGESGPNDEYLLLLHREVEKMGGDPYLEDLVSHLARLE
ncbi:hypothetical protein KL937_002912 [Ogataea polymorpha]|nr:hypothetical protein KL937_002912 [Ogataea polymorpha]KAG7937911.1 hypothetical protein KL904_002058 [Ogataea polymorpha]